MFRRDALDWGALVQRARTHFIRLIYAVLF